jgi:hypothetical protein
VVAVVVGEVSLPLPSSTKQVVERASDEGFRRGMVGLRRIPCKHRFLDACVEANVPTVCGYAVPHTAHADETHSHPTNPPRGSKGYNELARLAALKRRAEQAALAARIADAHK